MAIVGLTLLILFVFGITGGDSKRSSRPNIIIIIADDLGWNDVSFHGSLQIPTPNLDALAYSGIMLNRHYTPPLCTPSRASLMTGKHPINIGMQHHVIESDQPWGLGLDQKLMPQYFQEAGYKTRLVGKWHLGFFQKAYTPTQRGFESHFGYVGPYIDYWDHSLQMSNSSTRGLDIRRDLEVDYTVNGTYATDLFNSEAVRIVKDHNRTDPLFLVLTHLAPHAGNEDDPLQAPEEDVQRFSYIKNENRRVLAAMISRMDKGIGEVVRALKQREMLDNSIILFFSDNGAPSVGTHANSGSNFPLRGQKYSPWEGAVRTPAIIWSPLLGTEGRISNQWFHTSDWLPTLARVAQIKNIPRGSAIDGVDQWRTLLDPTRNVRSVVLNNIDRIHHYSSFIKDGWKYVNGSSWDGKYDYWLGMIGTEDSISEEEYWARVANSTVATVLLLDVEPLKELRQNASISCEAHPSDIPCDPLKAPCIFNLIEDPCERNNTAVDHPDIVQKLGQEVQQYFTTAVEPRNKPSDPRSDPLYYNVTWTWWQDEPSSSSGVAVPVAIFVVAAITVGLLVAYVKRKLCPVKES
ncbi:arylsulfatase B-like [Wyeomyia smithii]|uniref:arylsulfatase B-like n=1 Tax=Wyeomyia smithii TaxID=174621 RepID=UPI002467B941|nr:arylsulfatase B-like [Wyeomyia smithii]